MNNANAKLENLPGAFFARVKYVILYFADSNVVKDVFSIYGQLNYILNKKSPDINLLPFCEINAWACMIK